MKKTFTAIFAVVTTAALANVQLKNADFEAFGADGKPSGWYLPDRYRVLKGEGMNGSAGLVYENHDPQYYQNASQKYAVEPGATYRFGAWVKVHELSGKGGVALVIGWYNKDGKWLDESQTALIRKATEEWVKLEGISKPVSDEAASGSFAFVCQRGALGRIAFDKAFCERYVRAPVAGVYMDAYRGEASQGEVRFAAALTPEAFGVKPSEVKAVFTVEGPDGKTFAVDGKLAEAGDEAGVTVAVEKFAFGRSEVSCVLKVGAKTIGCAKTEFTRVEKLTPRKVYLDRHGRAVVDGKLFFPLGMYTGQMTAKDVAMYRESHFNCLMQYSSPTSEQMKLFRDAGLKVIYDIASQYRQPDKGTNSVRYAVKKFKDDPVLLAWYLYDEQPTAMIPTLVARQKLVESLDADHPTWCAQDIFSETRHYIGACDVFGGDPYPVSTKPVSFATEAIREEIRGLMGMRPVWQVVQAFGWNWINEREAERQRRPSEAEMRNMAWQALAGGARGLIFYNFGYLCREMERREPVEELWPELQRISEEIMRHSRVLLFADTEAIPDKHLPKGVVGRLFRENGEMWRLLVNTTDKQIGDFRLPPFGVSMTDTCGLQDALLRDGADR